MGEKTPPARTPIRTFTNQAGRVFAVRVIPSGARYGKGNALTNESEPMVEFYDATYADDSGMVTDGITGVSGFGPLGQLVSRYYVTDLVGVDGFKSFPGGLCLDGDNAEVWTIDALTMTRVRSWLLCAPGALPW